MQLDVLTKLDEIDRQILLIKYSHRHLSLEAIGKRLSPPMSKQAIHQRVQKSKIKDMMESLDRDVLLLLKELHLDAVVVMRNSLKSKNERIAYQAAKDLLTQILDQPQLLPQRDNPQRLVIQFCDHDLPDEDECDVCTSF